MEILLCIDDTDNLESIGTGELLENLCAALAEHGLGQGGFVTRHQLYLHEDIPYTSHNSSMCCAVTTDAPDALAAFSGAYLAGQAAPGSDPGLCVARLDRLRDAAELMAFGRRAKQEVLSKEDAYGLAARYPGSILLSEYGGSGLGVIGALAGVGLRLSGADGKVKGKILSAAPGEILRVASFCRKYGVERAIDAAETDVAPNDTVIFRGETKAVFRDYLPCVCLTPDEAGAAQWRPLTREEIKHDK